MTFAACLSLVGMMVTSRRCSCGSSGIQPAAHRGSSSWCMILSAHSGGIGVSLPLVPLAKPQDVLGCGWRPANGALLCLAGFSELYCSLYPCFQMWPEFSRQLFDHLAVYMPVQAGDQMLMMLSLSQATSSLVLSFSHENLLNLPPWILK